MATKVTKTKMCSKHGVEHPVTDFPKDAKQHDRLSTWCKAAWREYRADKAKGGTTAKKVEKKAAPAKKVAAAAKSSKKAAKEVN